MGWIEPLTKNDPKSLLVSPNLDSNKSWILVENKALIEIKQGFGYS
jgi:hypothetical protein